MKWALLHAVLSIVVHAFTVGVAGTPPILWSLGTTDRSSAVSNCKFVAGAFLRCGCLDEGSDFVASASSH